MGAGRFVCVAVPFGLTLASLVCILIAMLSGVTNKDLDMFEVKTQNLSISSSSLANLENLVFRRAWPPLLTTTALEQQAAAAAGGNNITAADLGLADSYKVSLFTYCSQTGSKNNCTAMKFDWASSALNTTALETLASKTSGVTVTLPKELKTSLKTFVAVSKWTQVVYLIALVTCAIELFFGIFAICSRAGSCLTFLVAGLATTTIIAASIMGTVQSAIVTGAIQGAAKAYGVHASINTGYLAVTWIAAAFSIAAGMVWSFTICCCASEHNSNKSRRSRGFGDTEKLVPTGAYQRVEDPHQFNNAGAYQGQEQGIYHGQQYGVPMNNVKQQRGNAYEPYAHTAI
jgi:hypothetical protein